MDIEKIAIKIYIDKSYTTMGELFLYEEAPDDADMVMIELIFGGRNCRIKNQDFFSALQELRKELEKDKIQLICNGCSRNVYPSPMQFSMGNTKKAYKLFIGKRAALQDMVDIFDIDDGLEFVTVNEQIEFYNNWLKAMQK